MTANPACELFIDGASRGNPGPASVGCVLRAKNATRHFSKYLGETTNNAAEYLALIYGLQEALKEKCDTIAVKTDSELLARQINGQYKVRDPQLRLFFDLACHMIGRFKSFEVSHIPRELNTEADKLAGDAVRRQGASRVL